MHRACLALTLIPLVSACAASGSSSYVRNAPTAAAPTPVTSAPAPRIQREVGLESVIGERASSLTQRFGEARIDLAEGDARKLQFVSNACVLDIFLYPLEGTTNPVATHVEARARSGGGATDRAACIAEVERGARGG